MSRYKINIMEHQYYINTDRDPAWVKMLQERLNGQIDEIREGCPNLSAFDTFAQRQMCIRDRTTAVPDRWTSGTMTRMTRNFERNGKTR